MSTQRFDLNLFLVFDAIYTERNLTQAGHVLGITQPAVSNALARLRELFEDPLFERSPKGMVPTPIAENTIQSVREALHLLRTSIQEGKHFDPATSNRQFIIACGDPFENLLMPGLVKELQQQAPSIDIVSTRVRRREMSNLLAAGEIDLAVDIPNITSPHIHHQKLAEDKFVVAVRRDHKSIAQRLTLKKYVETPHILVSSRPQGPGVEDMALAKLGLSRRIGFRTPHIYTAALTLQQTEMIMTVPSKSIDFLNLFGEVKLLNPPIDIDDMEAHLYWHESRDQDPANHWLREFVLSIQN